MHESGIRGGSTVIFIQVCGLIFKIVVKFLHSCWHLNNYEQDKCHTQNKVLYPQDMVSTASAFSNCSMQGSRKFARGDLTLTMFFSDNEGERIQIPLKLGHHRLASEMPFKWRFTDGPMMAQHWMLAWFFRGWGPVRLKTLQFCNFSGEVRTPCPPPPLDPPMCSVLLSYSVAFSFSDYAFNFTLTIMIVM